MPPNALGSRELLSLLGYVYGQGGPLAAAGIETNTCGLGSWSRWFPVTAAHHVQAGRDDLLHFFLILALRGWARWVVRRTPPPQGHPHGPCGSLLEMGHFRPFFGAKPPGSPLGPPLPPVLKNT